MRRNPFGDRVTAKQWLDLWFIINDQVEGIVLMDAEHVAGQWWAEVEGWA